MLAVVIRMAGLRGRKAGITRKPCLAFRPCAAAAHLKLQFVEHRERGAFTVSAICNQGGFPIRAAGNLGTLYLELQSSQTVLRPVLPFQSARLPRVDTGALSGVHRSASVSNSAGLSGCREALFLRSSSLCRSRRAASPRVSRSLCLFFIMGSTMTEGTDKVLSKSDKSTSMSDTTFMQNNLPEVFDPRRYGSVKAAQIAAYDFMRGRVRKQLKLRRVRQLWEGKASRVDGEEKDALREAKIEEARNEYKAVRLRLEHLEAVLASVGKEDAGTSLDSNS